MLARPELTQAQLDLLAAADVLESREHCQERFMQLSEETQVNKVCMWAALAIAVGVPEDLYAIFSAHDNERFREASEKFNKSLKTPTIQYGEPICQYNNTHNKDECVKAFREAAYN